MKTNESLLTEVLLCHCRKCICTRRIYASAALATRSHLSTRHQSRRMALSLLYKLRSAAFHSGRSRPKSKPRSCPTGERATANDVRIDGTVISSETVGGVGSVGTSERAKAPIETSVSSAKQAP